MDRETRAKIKEKVARLPLSPGVYLMRDKAGTVIYVGKAKALKNRVSQYFVNLASHTKKTRRMVEQVHDFDYFVTATEMEALILECSQIKLYMPKYNILLKDNKTYPYIKIDLTTDFSKVEISRKRPNDGARYFGPYSGGVKQIIDTVNRTFALPDCTRKFPRDFGRERPCLKRDIGLCMAPCTGEITAEQYRETLRQAADFLQGDYEKTAARLREEMERHAERMEFEQAAQVRDRLRALEKLTVRQKVVAAPDVNRDVIGCAVNELRAVVEIFYIRGGRIVDRQSYQFPAEAAEDREKLMADFLVQLYSRRADIPPEILLSEPSEDRELAEAYLRELRGRPVTLAVPQRGEKRKLCDMVSANAAETLRLLMTRAERQSKLVAELQKLLGLSEPPVRIEAVDISNTAGSDTVGAIVCYENGEPEKSGYRRYQIGSVAEGQDDYAAMKEVMARRFVRALNGEERWRAPDLLLLDGGAGHLSVVSELLSGMGISVPVYGMVKDDKHRTRALVSAEGEIELKVGSPAAALVGQIQEEVHRFAIGYHREKRRGHVVGSTLTKIEGIGETRAKALLRAFGSVKAVSEAELPRLQMVKGMNERAARAVYDYFHK